MAVLVLSSVVCLSLITRTTASVHKEPLWDCPITFKESSKEFADCSKKELDSVPQNLPINLKWMDISRNRIKNIQMGSFTRYVHLQRLVVSHNSIHEIHMDAFRGLANLDTLDLSHNNLSQIPSSSFYQFRAGLLHLKLSGNPLVNIGAESFPNLQKLKILELENCGIHQVNEQAFRGMTGINELNLSQNKLKTMSPKTFNFFADNLNELHIYGNEWKCECDLQELFVWVTKTMNPYISWEFGYGTPRCTTPMRLKGSKWSDLGRKEFMCPPHITYTHSPRFVTIRDDVFLRCAANGSPVPKFKWFKNDVVIKDDADFQILHSFRKQNSSSSLQIHNFTENDQAVYRCMAENNAGNESHYFHINFGEPPLKIKKWKFPTISLLAVTCVTLSVFIVTGICCIWVRKKMGSNRGKLGKVIKKRGGASEKSSQIPLHRTSNTDVTSECYEQSFKTKKNLKECDKEMLEKYLNDQRLYTPQTEKKSFELMPQPMTLADHFSEPDILDSGACTMTTGSDRDVQLKDDTKDFFVHNEGANTVLRYSSKTMPVPVRTPAIPQPIRETDILSDNQIETRVLFHRPPNLMMDRDWMIRRDNEFTHHLKDRIDICKPHQVIPEEMVQNEEEEDLIKVLSVDI